MSVADGVFDVALTRATGTPGLARGECGPPRPARLTPAEALRAAAAPLPERLTPADVVVDQLVALAEPGLMTLGSGRFFGWVAGLAGGGGRAAGGCGGLRAGAAAGSPTPAPLGVTGTRVPHHR